MDETLRHLERSSDPRLRWHRFRAGLDVGIEVGDLVEVTIFGLIDVDKHCWIGDVQKFKGDKMVGRIYEIRHYVRAYLINNRWWSYLNTDRIRLLEPRAI